MPDEPEGTTTIETTEPGMSDYIGPDGALKEGWKENLLPEEIRKDGTWDRFSNLQDVFKSESEARKLVSKKGLILPTDKSPPEEWDAFHKALGRPDKPEEYGLKRPDEIPEDFWDDEILTSATKAFHEVGLPSGQAKKLFDWYNQRTLDTIKAIQQENEQAERLIRGEAGNKYDEIAQDGHRLMQDNLEGLPQPIRDGILNEINDPKTKPYLFFLLANIQKHFDEHTALQGGELPGARGIDQQIAEIEAQPEYLDLNRTNPAKHKLLIEQAMRLREQKLKMQSKG